MEDRVIGVIGGSGLYEIEGLEQVDERRIDTPFGAPSDVYVQGRLGDRRVLFLPRHGRGHRLLPGEVNARANIHGFKQLGAQWLISVSAVGSMKEEIAPGDMVIVDQFIDRTRGRPSSFFGGGVVGHVEFADPVCHLLADALRAAAEKAGAKVHPQGTYLCIEGPQFSTRAESRLYRQWGVDVIGMTNIPEAKLAREAGICYASLAMATDYDCWYASHEDVSVDAVIEVLRRNVGMARRIVGEVVGAIGPERPCGHADAGRRAVITSPEMIPPQARRKLSLILGEQAAVDDEGGAA